MLYSSSTAGGEGCALEDEPPVVLLDFVSWSRDQAPPEGQVPFLPLTPLWTCQPVSTSPSMVPGAAGMWSRSPANYPGGGISCVLKPKPRGGAHSSAPSSLGWVSEPGQAVLVVGQPCLLPCCGERGWTGNALLHGAARLPLCTHRQECKNLAWHSSIFPIERGFRKKRPGKRVLEAIQGPAPSVPVQLKWLNIPLNVKEAPCLLSSAVT